MNRAEIGPQDPIRLASEAQARAADPRHSAWVSASAGSGKTKLLVDRLLRLLLDGVPPTRILCLTYTRAAAAEMRNRIDATLSSWAASNPEALRKSLTELTPQVATTGLQDKAKQLFAKLLDAPGGMRIEKVLQVRGLADVQPLQGNDPNAPTNRRISILVMNKAAEQAFFRDGGRAATIDDGTPAAPAVQNAVKPIAMPAMASGVASAS